jgi:SGNH domain-containing protein
MCELHGSLLVTSVTALNVEERYRPDIDERSRLATKVDDDAPERPNYYCTIQMADCKGSLAAGKCHFGAKGQGTDLAPWGDSHALALAPMLLALQQHGSPTFEQLTMGSCLPLVHQNTGRSWRRSQCSECKCTRRFTICSGWHAALSTANKAAASFARTRLVGTRTMLISTGIIAIR